jgi:hypothetical protein
VLAKELRAGGRLPPDIVLVPKPYLLGLTRGGPIREGPTSLRSRLYPTARVWPGLSSNEIPTPPRAAPETAADARRSARSAECAEPRQGEGEDGIRRRRASRPGEVVLTLLEDLRRGLPARAEYDRRGRHRF